MENVQNCSRRKTCIRAEHRRGPATVFRPVVQLPGSEMHPEPDDLAAAAEYICVRLYPQEQRRDYVQSIRGRRAFGDVPWEGLVALALDALAVGMTNIFCALFGAYLYDRFKKPDSNVQRLMDQQRATLAKLDKLLSEGPPPQEKLSDPANVAMREDWTDSVRAVGQFHESILLKVQDSDPTIAAMVDDALRQLEARGAKALVNDVHAAGNCPFPAEDAPMMRWWNRPDRPDGT